jgi:hypothetical protein
MLRLYHLPLILTYILLSFGDSNFSALNYFAEFCYTLKGFVLKKISKTKKIVFTSNDCVLKKFQIKMID